MIEAILDKLMPKGRKRQFAECFLVFAASFLLCGVGFYGEIAPAGICFQGCFAGKRRMFFAFLGVVLGSCVWGYSPVKYIAVSLIVIVMNEAFMHIADIGEYVYALFGVTGAMGLIGLVSLISPESDKAGLMYISELVICAMLSVLMFGVAGGKSVSEKHGGKTVPFVLICALCASLIPSFIIGRTQITPSHVIISSITAYAAMKTGVYGGITVGLVSGLALDLSGTEVPVWCFSLAFGGMGAGFTAGKKPAVRVLIFFLLSSAARLLSLGHGGFLVCTFEILLGALVLLFVPSRFLQGTNGIDDDGDGDYCLRNSKKQLSEFLLGMSDAYGVVADSYADGTEKLYTMKSGLSVYEGACKNVCSSCGNKHFCWEEKSDITKNVLESALPSINARGAALSSDFGKEFSCIRSEDFCTAVTDVLRDQRREMLVRGEKLVRNERMQRQYRTISEILDDSAGGIVNDTVYDRGGGRTVRKLISEYGVDADVAVYKDNRGVFHVEVSGRELNALYEHTEHITRAVNSALGRTFELPIQTEGKNYSCIAFKECPKHDFAVGANAEKRSGEQVSGDSATYFRDNEGNLFVVLCDGMGSGENAHKRAEEIMRLCENFLRIGVSPVNAAEIVAATLEQQDDGAGGVTLDIARIDPYTSVMTSVKYGAAPTYIRHRTADGRYSLSKICAGGAGGELYGIAEAETELQEGDTVLLVSDGAESGSCIEKSLVGIMTDDPSDLSEILMHMLPRDAADDRTIIAVSYLTKSNVQAKKERYCRS